MKPTFRSEPTGKGAAYEALRSIYNNSAASWRRLNGALQSVLGAAITAGLSFEIDDFKAIRSEMKGGYWMGNSCGSETGEGYYSLAVEVNHVPACLSFEKMVGRPPALWPEQVKTPQRLCIGSQFTWEGLIVKVTNLKKDHLIACSYSTAKGASVSYGAFKQGQLRDFDGYRTIDELQAVEDGSLFIRLSEPIPLARVRPDSVPERIFKITYEALTAKRKEYDATRKQALKDIVATETPAALDEVMTRLSEATKQNVYRHFDIEDIRTAYSKQMKAFDERAVEEHRQIQEAERARTHDADLERWVAGEEIYRHFSVVRLRVKGIYIETSTGHRVTIASARPLIPWALKHRLKVGPVTDEHKVDLHRINRFTEKGVVIGCTLIPWGEVERLQSIFNSALEGAIEEQVIADLGNDDEHETREAAHIKEEARTE